MALRLTNLKIVWTFWPKFILECERVNLSGNYMLSYSFRLQIHAHFFQFTTVHTSIQIMDSSHSQMFTHCWISHLLWQLALCLVPSNYRAQSYPQTRADYTPALRRRQ